MKKQTTRQIRKHKMKTAGKPLQMLTAYDYQTAQMLNETSVDIILVGDSLGNVVLGFDQTINVTVDHMCLFGAAVRRGAPEKFIVVDMPFGSTNTLEKALSSAEKIMRETGAEALKIEGAFPHLLEIIQRLTHCGIPVMGHIGLTPQSVHQQGGFYTHGKNEDSAKVLIEDAQKLQDAGCFSVVLECIEKTVAKNISEKLFIPTIGIGSGHQTDGQVLVINDLFRLGKKTPPSFVKPIANFYEQKQKLIEKYLGTDLQ